MYSKTQVEKYIEEIQKYPICTKEEEYRLAERIQSGDEEALKRLVEANLRFVVLVSKKYLRSGIPLADLINEGTIGLIEAAKRFKPERGVRFITYAVWWIRQAILFAIAEKGRIIRIPVKQEAILRNIHKAQEKLQQKLRREPTIEEIAEEIGIPENQVEYLMQISRSSISLDALLTLDGEKGKYYIEDTASLKAEQQAIEDQFVDDIELLLTCLSDREKEILKLRFSFEGRSLSLKEIGERYNLTKERIRQIEQKAISKLRKLAIQRKLKDYLE